MRRRRAVRRRCGAVARAPMRRLLFPSFFRWMVPWLQLHNVNLSIFKENRPEASIDHSRRKRFKLFPSFLGSGLQDRCDDPGMFRPD